VRKSSRVSEKVKHTRKAKPRGRVLRAYRLPQYANQGKVDQLRAVHAHYMPLVQAAAGMQYRRLLSGQKIWNAADPSHLPSELSQRYRRSANNQACEALQSWAALVEIEVRKVLQRSSLHPDRRRLLAYVNARHDWYARRPDGAYDVPARIKDDETGQWVTVDGAFDVVSAEDMRLLRGIVKHVRRRKVSLPRLAKGRTMKLDGIVAQWQNPKHAQHFDLWLNISTLSAGKPVKIPLNATRHANSRAGEWTNTAQITIPKNPHEPVIVALVKDTTPAEKPEPSGGAIGLDFGLRTLFATSEGDLLGHGFYQWLQRIDEDLTTLTTGLQRQGIKPNDSKRYRAMQRRIREHAKNEINRILNRIIDLHDPSVLAVEELDFRHGGLSKRLNRIITRVGRAQLKSKLAMLAQETGVTIIPVPAAYSSQECASCGYVDNRNRTNTHFSCRFCGRKGHADIEAARTVKSRRSWPSARLTWARPTILAEIDRQFETRWGTSPTNVRTQGRRKPASAPPRPTADGLHTAREDAGQYETETMVAA